MKYSYTLAAPFRKKNPTKLQIPTKQNKFLAHDKSHNYWQYVLRITRKRTGKKNVRTKDQKTKSNS